VTVSPLACPDGTPVMPEFVTGAYHRLLGIEKSFRMAKSDLQARPIYHRKRDSIEAHPAIVFAALAVGHWIETTTGWSIKKSRPYRPPVPHHHHPSRPAHHHRANPSPTTSGQA
jgi:hypothetical protein